jgi:hypothetical protein
MHKTFGLISASVIASALACSGAQAMPSAAASIRAAVPGVTLVWDNCGVGFHRNVWGRCHSNYGPNSGCRPGYHVGVSVYRCVPNGSPN